METLPFIGLVLCVFVYIGVEINILARKRKFNEAEAQMYRDINRGFEIIGINKKAKK